MSDIRIIKAICPLSEIRDGWQKELNVVSVDGGPFVYDIREWRLDHFDYHDGISLDEQEAIQLLKNLRLSLGLPESDMDAIQIQMPVVEKAFDVSENEKADIQMVLKERGIPFIDKREYGGALWVVGGHDLDSLMAELKEMGYRFYFSEKGGKVSKGEAAWFLKANKG